MTSAATISQYQRSAARAQASGIRVIARGYRKADAIFFFVVTSATQPGKVYRVAVEDTGLVCNCTAGQHGRYCQHRALVHDTMEREANERRERREAARAAKHAVQVAKDALRANMPLYRDNRAFSIFKPED